MTDATFHSSEDGEALSLQQLRSVFPAAYARWVRIAVDLAIVGYLVSGVGRFAGGGTWLDWVRSLEPAPLAALLLAAWWSRRGAPEHAARLAIAAVWLQLVVGLVGSEDGVRDSGTASLSAIVVFVALLLGPRVAMICMAATTIAVPSALWVGGALGLGRGLPAGDVGALGIALVVLWSITVLLSGFLRAFFTVVTRLRANEAQRSAIVDAAPDAIVGLGADAVVLAFNAAAERALGVRAAEVIGRPFAALPLRTLEGNPLDTHDGVGLLSVIGRDTVLESMVRRVRSSGDGLRMLLVLRDVTARRRAEARTQELTRQLEHAQRLEAVGRLAGGVAHDFNNLLTVLAGGVAFLADHPDPDVRELGAELGAAQERGRTLTRRLLSFARRGAANPQVVDLAGFLERERVLVQRILGERLVLDLDPVGPAPVLLDEGQAEQVLLNLVVNARDAMGRSGTLYLGCRPEGDTVLLTVRDTGAGMNEEVRSHLFEPFFTTKGAEGTGLGLSTVHGIVTGGGGTVEVESAPGAGTTFRLRFPRSAVTVSAPPPAAPAPRSEGRGARILLVEDDDLTRDFARRALVRMGHAVEVARNGAEALDRIGRDVPYDLVLSDVAMPVMTGPELLARLRGQGVPVPVLLMSGYVDDVLEDGTFDVTTQLLLKPFSMEELSRRVAAALRSAA